MTDANADRLRVAVIADLLEEEWPSMDLVADMLTSEYARDPATASTLVRAPFTARLGRVLGTNGRPPTVDRIVNRYWDYPRWLRAHPPAADVHHIVDHSYAHLVDALPSGRVVVTCHDTDAFRTLFAPDLRESSLPRALVRRSLRGLGRAAVVACVSEATRTELARHGVVQTERLAVVPNGVHPSCRPEPDPVADGQATELLASDSPTVDVLHVGSTIPRKRIDMLLDLVAALVDKRPDVRLVRVGGPFTPAQEDRVRGLGIARHVRVLPFVSRPVLAAVYRRAALVVLPSDREGFGLPIVEAMACGTPVVASDLPVLREVGGGAVEYCSVGDVAQWQAAVLALVAARAADPAGWHSRQQVGLGRASLFSWERYARQMRAIYASVASGLPHGAS